MTARHLLPLMLLLLTLQACPRETQPEERVAINLWHTFNPEETGTLNTILERVQQQPRWRVQATVIPFARAQNKFRQATQRCTPAAPHVFRAELPWVAEFVSKGLIRPVASDAPPDTAFLPQAREASRYQGQRWILPANLDCLALMYNRTFLERPPATMAQFVTRTRQMTVDAEGRDADQPGFNPGRTVRWGFYVRAEAYWFLPFLWANGGRMLDPDPPRVFIDEPPATRALAFYRDLIQKHHVAPPRPSPSNDYEDQLQRFGNGTLVMMVNGPWATSAVLARPAFRQHPDRLGIAPFPSGPSGKPAAPMSGHGWVVSRCAPDPVLAWRLAAALSDAEAQATFAQNNSLLPALEQAYRRAEVRSNPFIAGFRAALARSRSRPQHPAIARIFDDFNPAVQAVLLGDADPLQALAGVGRAWRRLLGIRPPAPDGAARP